MHFIQKKQSKQTNNRYTIGVINSEVVVLQTLRFAIFIYVKRILPQEHFNGWDSLFNINIVIFFHTHYD
jgi:hypothetical protein